jgi:DNA-directed RNA polymerase specialized sigma24 family protein
MSERAGQKLEVVLAAVLSTPGALGDTALRDSWYILYPLWRGYLFAVGAKMGLRPEAMEDMIHDVLQRILDRWEKYRQSEAKGVLALSCKAMLNRVWYEFRRRKRWRLVPLDAMCEEPITPGASEDAYVGGRGGPGEWLCMRLVKLDRQQPENCRLLRLHFFEGRSYVDLAAKEGRSVDAIKGRIKRGLQGLRVLMAEHPPDGDPLR